MTMVSFPGTPLLWPGPFHEDTLAAFGSTGTLDAAGDYSGVVFQARQAMTISHVGFRTATVAGSPTADVRVETVGTDGLPSGTLWAVNTNIVTGTLSSNTWALHALTASASIAVGDLVAIKFAYNSGTSIQVANISAGAALRYTDQFSYRVVNTGAGGAKDGTVSPTIACVGSSTTAFYALGGMFPATAETDTDFTSASSPNRYGLRFKVPFKCRVIGGAFTNNQTGDFTMALYNDAGTLLASRAVDGDHYANMRGSVILDSAQTLTADTWYRLTVEATSGTQEVQTITLPSADFIDATPWGANAHLTTHNGSAWDDSNTNILPFMNILIDQVDDGTGTGGAAATTAHTFS